MSSQFAHLPQDPVWRETVLTWVHEQAANQGIEVANELTEFRVRPWSVHLTIESDAGLLWFKAVCEAMLYEPRLHQQLASLVPDAVSMPLAIDASKGWLLTADHGEPLLHTRTESAHDWLAVIREVADLQQRLMRHRVELLVSGLPDCGPETVVDRFDRLTVLLSDLPPEHPSHLDLGDRARLAEARDALVAAVDVLVAGPIGASWQHGDVHLDNVYVDGDQLRVFDFGDGQWAHVLETLVVPFSILNSEHPDWWRQIRKTYADAWDVSDGQFERLWAAALRTQAVNRAATWQALHESTIGIADVAWAPMARQHLLRSANV